MPTYKTKRLFINLRLLFVTLLSLSIKAAIFFGIIHLYVETYGGCNYMERYNQQPTHYSLQSGCVTEIPTEKINFNEGDDNGR